jgi:hypothetical protein
MTKHVLAFALATIGLASAGHAGDDRQNLPLADIRISDGQAAKVEIAEGRFFVRNAAAIEARIVAPADAFLCRLASAGNRDVVQLAVGRVDSLRCDSLYSPSRDEAMTFEADRVAITWRGGHYCLEAQGPLGIRVERNFMKTKRGLPFFRPLDKSAFARAPAGWCSWYVFWQGIREEQVTQNTDWLAANLKQFGCEYVQIDDGWQGIGQGNGENRDWYVTEKNKFPHGMKWLADYIRAKGLTPGIWLIPFATSDGKTFRDRPELFVRRADGSSVYETPDAKTGKIEADWTGRYVVDPTSPKAHAWFTDLFHMICDQWGYDYVKIDGQGGSVGACRQYRQRLADPKIAPDDAYRSGLATIKSVMGPKRFLLNCGGEYSSCGYCEGIRTGGDVGGADWAGMKTAIQATMERLYVNHLGFWADPDVVCVRPPLTLDQARAWATMVGITGQLLMTSDDMPKLGDDRVEILRRIFPVADIRPMDLYPLPGKPRIFDLRVSTPQAGQWDVVAMFNWDSRSTVSLRLEPKELGWPAGDYVYYDVWEKKLLGVGKTGLMLGLPPTSCKLVAARPMTSHPQLVGTSRHITQGADDLLEARWDSAAGKWVGRSRVVGGDPYQLRFTLPPGWTCTDTRATIEGPLAVFTLRSDKNRTVPWQIGFQRHPASAAKPQISHAKVTGAHSAATIAWKGAGAVAYRVYRNGELLCQTNDTRLTDRGRPRGDWGYEVSTLDWQGGETARTPAGVFHRMSMPRAKAQDAWLDDLNPILHDQDYDGLVRRRSVDQNPLRIGGKEFARGLGTHANCQIQFPLGNRYQRFEALVGVDDEKQGAGSVVFRVVVDGRPVFDSGVMRGKQPAKKISVPLDGAEELLLIVTDAGDGITCDHADWAEARLIGNR